jgi:RNA polymerase sigma-70 factor (ECF subfamily)
MSSTLNFSDWALQWRAPMLKFVRLHIQPAEEAEDAVQDAFAALMEVGETTLRQVDPKLYLFGILKNKISDRLRRKYRAEVNYADAFTDDMDELLFNERGHWLKDAAPALWQSPEAAFENEQFFAVVDLCMHKLPTKVARVFSMKQLLDCDADEVCTTLAMSKADYWQCMSRARKQIQLCLSQTWFDGGAP